MRGAVVHKPMLRARGGGVRPFEIGRGGAGSDQPWPRLSCGLWTTALGWRRAVVYSAPAPRQKSTSTNGAVLTTLRTRGPTLTHAHEHQEETVPVRKPPARGSIESCPHEDRYKGNRLEPQGQGATCERR